MPITIEGSLSLFTIVETMTSQMIRSNSQNRSKNPHISVFSPELKGDPEGDDTIRMDYRNKASIHLYQIYYNLT